MKNLKETFRNPFENLPPANAEDFIKNALKNIKVVSLSEWQRVTKNCPK